MNLNEEGNLKSGQKWTVTQFRTRLFALMEDGFTPEEANDITLWTQRLDFWVIEGMRRDRRQLISNLKRQDPELTDEEISERMTRRYIDLGIEGQYISEEWYFERVGAGA